MTAANSKPDRGVATGWSSDPKVTDLINTPVFGRHFWRAVRDAANGPMLPANNLPIFTANYSALTNNGAAPLALDSPFSIDVTNSYTPRSWLAQRWNKLTNDLASVAAPFAITNNNGNNFAVTNQASVTLAGKAPVEVAYIRINGATTNANLVWTSVTNWSLGFALAAAPATNTITVRGFDRLNQMLATNLYQKSITITNK